MGDAKYKQNHIKLGLCQDCSEPIFQGRYCLKHYWRKTLRDRKYVANNREKQRLYSAEWRRRNEEAGNCNRCGCPLIEGEGKRCVNCATIIVRHAV